MVNRYQEMDAAIVGDAETGSEVRQNLYTLCDEIGTRFAGTEGDRQAAQMICGAFDRYGLAGVHLEEFRFTAWRRGKAARLSLLEPRAVSLPCYAMPYGAPTGPDGIAAHWVDVGSGSAAEVETQAANLKGAFALTDGTSGSRKALQRRCVAAGAVGVLHGHKADGMHCKTGSVEDGAASPIAAVSIPAEVLATLRRVPSGGRLHLFVDCACEPSTTCNVVGALVGTEKPEELVILGGHFDSHDISPGAYDNATGVTIVMEAARLLQPFRKHLKRTIRFVAFGAEEMGLLGSHHHAKTHAAGLQQARFMLNCDTPCLGRPHGLAFHKCAAAEPLVQKLARQMGAEIPFANRTHNASDHYPFLLQGLITAGLGGNRGASRGAAYYHMAADTPEKLVLEELSDTAAFVARILLRAANDDAWPALQHD